MLWHDFDSDAWRALARDGAAAGSDETSREPTRRGDRMYSKAAARLFDGVEHVDALAVFRVKPALAQQMRWLE